MIIENNIPKLQYILEFKDFVKKKKAKKKKKKELTWQEEFLRTVHPERYNKKPKKYLFSY